MEEALPVLLRRWAKRHERGSMERKLFLSAADELELGTTGLTGFVVMRWLDEQGVALMPWQESKLRDL